MVSGKRHERSRTLRERRLVSAGGGDHFFRLIESRLVRLGQGWDN